MSGHGVTRRVMRRAGNGAALRSVRDSRIRFATLLLLAVGLALGGAVWAGVGNTPPARRLERLTNAKAISTSVSECSAAHLSLSVHPLDEALNGSYKRYTITNAGVTACSIGGVPTLGWHLTSLLAPATSSTPITFPQHAAATASTGTFTLVPGAEASFWAFYRVCGRITSAVANPGNLVVSLSAMSGTLSLTGGNPDCDQNEVTVSALQPGVMNMAPGFTTAPESTAGAAHITPAATTPKPKLETTPYSERVYP